MKISIITATYNSADILQECINSFHSQSYPDKELIIIDGKSSDGTLDIIKDNSDKISCWTSEKDSGIYDALNKGIENASGDVIGLLHSDDIFTDENVLTKVAEKFNESGADSVYGDLVYVSRKNNEKIFRTWKAGDYSPDKILKGWMPPHPALFIKKDIYLKYGKFNTDYRIAADYDLVLRIFYKYKITTAYIPETLVKMRTGGASNRSLSNILQKSKEDYKALVTNKIPHPLYTLTWKNLGKVGQIRIG